jgi:hypothetical protein
MRIAAEGRINIVPKPDRRRGPQGPFSALRQESVAPVGASADEHLPAARSGSRAEAVGVWVVGSVSVGLIVLAAWISLG